MTYVIKFEGLEGTAAHVEMPPPEVDAWLAWYDPDAKQGGGETIWTTKLADALAFTSMDAAVEFYQRTSRVRPTRPDGKPNRPLTAFSVSIVPRPEGVLDKKL